MIEPKKIAIIDGKSVFYRGYYGMPGLTNSSGLPTGGVYGFATIALEIMKELKPDFVYVAWDKSKTNINARLKIYSEYKAGRKPPPPDFYEQIPYLHKLLDALGWELLEADDYEADDIMATLAKQADDKGYKTFLITSDLDMLQAISDHTTIYVLKKGFSSIVKFNEDEFNAKHNIKLNQYIDYKSLAGDSSDNIPGATGIGKKTATDLLNQFGDIDGIYNHLDQIKSKATKNKLIESKEMVGISKKLVTLMLDAPFELGDLDKDKSIDAAKLKLILDELEFKYLKTMLPKILLDIGYNDSSQEIASDNNLEINVLKTTKDVKKATISNQKQNKIFIHTMFQDRFGIRPLQLAFSYGDQTFYSINIKELSEDQQNEAILSLAENKQVIGYDLKHLIQLHQRLNKTIDVAWDIKIAEFNANSLTRDLSLAAIINNNCNSDLSLAAPEDYEHNQAGILKGIAETYHKQQQELQDRGQSDFIKNIEMLFIAVAAKMELAGIGVDASILNKSLEKIELEISDLEQLIYGYAEQEFNIASPAQLSKILFEPFNLNLPIAGIKKNNNGYSTAANELAKLIGTHPIIELIQKYRELSKIKSTYLNPLPGYIGGDNRIHGHFNLTVAQTGRISSTEPNLQNIPIKTPAGREIRRAFVAKKGKIFVSLDYSQFELRLAAYLANDTELIDNFNNGADIHNVVASTIFGVEQEEVTKEQRRSAKVINFGILYGMSPHGLSLATGMNIKQATEFVDKYRETRKPIFDYMSKLLGESRESGFVSTLYGRRRPTPDLKSSNFIVRSGAERATINFPIQGTESDIMKLAMIKLSEKLDEGSAIVLQIHDSIIIETNSENADHLAELAKNLMEGVAPEVDVELKVDYSIATTWDKL